MTVCMMKRRRSTQTHGDEVDRGGGGAKEVDVLWVHDRVNVQHHISWEYSCPSINYW